MVASSAFKELSEVLARLESSGTEVRHATVDQRLTGTDDVTAELSVGVPLASGLETSEAVSVTADGTDVDGGRVAVDLTVTVSPDDGAVAPSTGEQCTDGGTSSGSESTRPAYKRPDALRAAYERYDTFPEMTDALDVDVTPETVRRHMIKHDIHDPDDATPQCAKTGVDEGGTDLQSPVDGVVEPNPETASHADASTATGSGRGRSDPASRRSPTRQETAARSAVTDGGNAVVGESRARAGSPVATTPVGELLAEASARRRDGSPAGVALPDTLTVAGLTDAINRSRTVHEVTQYTGLTRETAERLLREFGLVHVVSRSLAAEQIAVSPDEIVRRIHAAVE
ncbi:hypothetical protein [Salinigranum marinum]|uniref:hypothetical protein n=1 Tax=Salinigranum marinum TaxID=1515595 RepID=UPI002989C3C1|nr:hypothetical protein [Salinigranum marinum]